MVAWNGKLKSGYIEIWTMMQVLTSYEIVLGREGGIKSVIAIDVHSRVASIEKHNDCERLRKAEGRKEKEVCNW